MAEMGRISRWLVNFGNARRSTRILVRVRGSLALPPSPRVLELGAGRGGFSALLQDWYRPSRLVVTDFAPVQVEAARTHLTQRWGRLPTTVELRAVDAKSLPFPDQSFDCVVAIDMLHHVEEEMHDYRERPGALREIRRVLVPGGYLVWKEHTRTAELRVSLRELGFAPVMEEIGRGGSCLGVSRTSTG